MLYNSKEDKERSDQEKRTGSYSYMSNGSSFNKVNETNDKSASDEYESGHEIKKENESRDDLQKETRFSNEKDILIVCSYGEYESEFRVFRSIEDVEHYIIETQNIENDLYIIENTDDNFQDYDVNVINRLFKSYKFISVANAIESGLIKEKDKSYDKEKPIEEEDSNNSNNDNGGSEQKNYYNDFDSTSLFLDEE